MGVYLRDNMGCMTDFGYVILDTNLPTLMAIQACSAHHARQPVTLLQYPTIAALHPLLPPLLDQTAHVVLG